AAVHVCCGADEAEVRRRAAAVHREVAEMRVTGAAGSPAEVAERLAAHVAAGAQTLYLQLLDPGDLDHLRLIADAVVPLLAGTGL
ncbi:MAG TPA: LLM class F420-dependent oxidoreductase, partial [Candidatus Dormibacteraeota bacterium]|nr:LLM class F420-dependent oxidoreductase [Candidatus Dormibacteraeota bacterium]